MVAVTTPPRRKNGLSALALTTVVAAAAGGPSIAAGSALFGCLGLVTEAPVALIALASGISAALADLIAINVGSSSFDKGVLPFVIFAVGATAAGVIENTHGPATQAIQPDSRDQPEIEEGRPNPVVQESIFGAWDKQLKGRDTKGTGGKDI